MCAWSYYSELIANLSNEQAGDTGYAICGKLVVAVSDDEVKPYQQARQVIHERQQQYGVPTS